MKTEQLIVQYLYSSKKMSLQDIGNFTIAGDVNIAADSDKDTALPPDAIRFEYDPKAPVDEGLINYIMEHTRKIRPLATSDLESYIMLNKQFLNIGKPLILEGVGTLQKTQAGEIAFTQADTSHVTHEEIPKAITEKQKEEISFQSPQREMSRGGNKAGIWIIVLLMLAGAGIAAWYFIRKHDREIAAEKENTVITDTAAQPTVDSAAMKKIKDSIAAIPPVNAVKDTNSFYVVIKEFTNREAAQKSYDKLTSYGNKLVMTVQDSSHIKLRMPFIRPLTDTLRVKDSLSKFFSAKAYIELP